MRTIKILSAALVAATALAALPASAQSSSQSQSSKYRCVNAKDVEDTISKDDGKTLTFKLRDGTTMVNHLITQCDSLRWGGFVWVTAPGGEICGGSQTLRTIANGEICRLGAFDPPVKMSRR